MNIQELVVPNTMEEVYQLLQEDPLNQIVGGGAWMRLSNKEVGKLIVLDNLPLTNITETDEYIEIGSMVTLRQLEINPLIKNLYDGILANAVSDIMGIQIRNVATIGGSVMGRYSFSDILPVLMVMDTTLGFYHQGEQSLTEYMSEKHPEKDILLYIRIAKKAGRGYFKKVCKTVLDFAILNIAISNLEDFTICVGARPGAVQLATNAMKYINEQTTITEEVIEQTVQLALQDIHVSSNSRASKEYRTDLLRVYLTRGLKEVY